MVRHRDEPPHAIIRIRRQFRQHEKHLHPRHIPRPEFPAELPTDVQQAVELRTVPRGSTTYGNGRQVVVVLVEIDGRLTAGGQAAGQSRPLCRVEVELAGLAAGLAPALAACCVRVSKDDGGGLRGVRIDQGADLWLCRLVTCALECPGGEGRELQSTGLPVGRVRRVGGAMVQLGCWVQIA